MNTALKKREKIGVLLTNIGTPDAPTKRAVRRYLNQFLSDPRVVKLPKVLWQPILKGFILPFRSGHSAKLYQKIWKNNESPLLTLSKKQAGELQKKLSKRYPDLEIKVTLGMNYGNPSIPTALQSLKDFQADKLIILPLFPQYSTTTTASTQDAVNKTLSTWKERPKIAFIKKYYNNRNYINAISDSIKAHWAKNDNQQKQSHLLFSFHGLPKSYIQPNEPYDQHCHETARLVAEYLNLKKNKWSIAFQSRVGKTEWLKPYCIDLLKKLPEQGIANVDVICPGFSADCLETLEEIAITNRQHFLNAGGKKFHYIPALNASEKHIDALTSIIDIYFNNHVEFEREEY